MLVQKMFQLAAGLALVALVLCSQCLKNEVCQVGQSCCQNPSGDVSCCPFQHGECCEDHFHCCPQGMLCNIKNLTCINATHIQISVLRMQAKLPKLPKSFRMISSLPASESNIACPDGSFCPAEFSCLLMSSSYGCCPVAQGRVCSDGKHCCPKDHECSFDSSSCVKRKVQVHTVLCGNGTSECPADTTCCKAKDNQWGCCPMAKSVCCEDKIHCCPENSVCDVKGSKCISSNNLEYPMWAKFPARLRADWEDHAGASLNSTVQCNYTVGCPDKNTCCKTKDGGWACCPLLEAVCCEDFLHCCPQGKKCNVGNGTCGDAFGSVPWLKKQPVQSVSTRTSTATQGASLNSTVHCNYTVGCPDKNTCCKTKDGGWACCPLLEAVCCEDFLHCCPQGKKCNVGNGTCEDASGSVPWLKKQPVQSVSTRTSAQGSKPNLHKMTPNAGTVPISSGKVNCSSSHVCPESSSCCKTKDEDWSCCPFPQAVCCTDGEHCCPSHYECNVSSLSCNNGEIIIPWYKKIPAVSAPALGLDLDGVKCDAGSNCSSDSTCCRLDSKEWGCCPFPGAVCCPDQKHCCPEGFGCDLRRHSCIKITRMFVEVIQLSHIQGRKPQSSIMVKDIQCGGGYSCKDSETCCPTSKNTWGCCPSPKAECCADLQHCCPAGYHCGMGGTCTSAQDLDWSNWLKWKLFFSKGKRAINI